MTVTLIAAVARNGVIGADGGIPWQVPGEQAFFRDATMGHTLVMGRATYDSIGRAAAGPHHDRGHPRPGLVRRRRPGRAARRRRRWRWPTGDVYVAGGATIYAAMIDSAPTRC